MIKTFLYGEDDSLPLLLKSLLKLRHGQITFQGAWNGTVGEVSDLHAVVEVHNPLLMDLILKNGVLGAAEGYIRGDWSSQQLVELIQILARNRDVLDQLNQNCLPKRASFFLKLGIK